VFYDATFWIGEIILIFQIHLFALHLRFFTATAAAACLPIQIPGWLWATFNPQKPTLARFRFSIFSLSAFQPNPNQSNQTKNSLGLRQ
jgi:hypothetical protein